MSTTSSMFLTLTPAMPHVENSNHVPGPIDHVTLNLAVESLTYHIVSGDTLVPIAKSLREASVGDESSVSQSKGSFTEQIKAYPPPMSDTSTDSESVLSVENHLDNPILPAVHSDNRDIAATILPSEFLSPATILKRRLETTKDLIVCPGVYDGFSARIALSVGFDALYMVSNIRSRLLAQTCLYHPDRCRHHSLSPRPTRPRPCTAQRHACACRHDCQP